MNPNTEEALQRAMQGALPRALINTDIVMSEASGFGMTVMGFNQVTLNGIVTRIEYRGPESRDGFIPHLKLWIAVPALVPVVFKGSPLEGIVKNPDRPAAVLGVPGITHMLKVPLIISGKTAAEAWGAVIERHHMVWVSGQMVPLVPFEPGEEGIAVLATQIQISSKPIKWDTERHGAVPWDDTYTDAFYQQLAKRRMPAPKPHFSKLRGKARATARERVKSKITQAKEDANKQFEMSSETDSPPWEKG